MKNKVTTDLNIKISGWSCIFHELNSHSSKLSTGELVAVVMGVNMIIKRNDNAAGAGGLQVVHDKFFSGILKGM